MNWQSDPTWDPENEESCVDARAETTTTGASNRVGVGPRVITL